MEAEPKPMEPKPYSSGEWTLQTLFLHFDKLLQANAILELERFQHQKERTDTALATSKEAIMKAEISVDKRLESMNEFRSTLKDQQQTYITRAEAMAQIDTLKGEVVWLREQLLKISIMYSGGLPAIK